MIVPEIKPCIRVAVVEDNAAFRRGLRAIFEWTPGIECAGMHVSGEEALPELPGAATELNLSATTVQTYLRRIYEKLQVHSQAGAVARYLR